MLSLTLVCVGRVKAGAERELASRYLDRAAAAGRGLGLRLDLRELDESRSREAGARKAEEGAAIRTSVEGPYLAFDETGRNMNSPGFAELIRQARDGGLSSLALVVGGPDGLDPALRGGAAHVLAFGAMTWPHQLVRIMVAEQLYRAVTILAGHPYHRA